MPIRDPLGWIQSQVPQRRLGKTHHPRWHHSLQRLEQPQRLFFQHAQAAARMFWVQKQRSWSSEMSSSAEKAKRSLHIELTLGSFFSITVTYLLNIPTSFLLCVLVLMPGSALFFLLMLPLIVLLYNYTLRLTAIWLLMSSGRAGTLARAHAKKLKPLSAPSNRLPSHGFLSQESPVNTVQFTTSPSPAPLPPRLPPSTALLIQTCTHVPGAPSTLYASPPFLTSPQGPKQPSVMLLKHTVQFPSSLTNGQAWMSNCLMRMNLPSIHATILVSPQPEAFMVVSEMQHSTFSALRELVPAQNGLTTTFSSGFFVSPLLFSRHPFYLHLSGEHLATYNLRRQVWHSTITLNGGRHQLGSRFWYQGESLPDDSPAEFDEDAACPLADHSSLPNCSDLDALFTYCDTDIDSISGQLGIPWEPSKTIPFSSSVPYLGFDWNLAERTVAITEKKKAKYGWPSESGCHAPPMTWKKLRSFTASCCMPASFFQPAALTSLLWKASWLPLAKTLLFLLVTPPQTSLGGSTLSTHPVSLDLSQDQPLSRTSMPSPTPAQVLASALLSAAGGKHGASSQVGRQMAGISDGLKPLASNFLLALSAQQATRANTSESSETTRESLRGGGKEEVEIGKLTRSSGGSTTSQILTSALLSHATLPAEKTQRTNPQEDSTRQ